jgi:hypothetical protein
VRRHGHLRCPATVQPKVGSRQGAPHGFHRVPCDVPRSSHARLDRGRASSARSNVVRGWRRRGRRTLRPLTQGPSTPRRARHRWTPDPAQDFFRDHGGSLDGQTQQTRFIASAAGVAETDEARLRASGATPVELAAPTGRTLRAEIRGRSRRHGDTAPVRVPRRSACGSGPRGRVTARVGAERSRN